MKVYYDTEFVEDGTTIDLISLAAVTEYGHEFYAISSEFDQDRARAHDFVSEHVLPHLPGFWREEGLEREGGEIYGCTEGTLDLTAPGVMRRELLRIKFLDFLHLAKDAVPIGRRQGIDLWAYYGAYDHIALMQLWGPMMERPGVLPMFTHDVRQRCEELLADPDDIYSLVVQDNLHKAIDDARWDAKAGAYLDEIEASRLPRLDVGQSVRYQNTPYEVFMEYPVGDRPGERHVALRRMP